MQKSIKKKNYCEIVEPITMKANTMAQTRNTASVGRAFFWLIYFSSIFPGKYA